MLHNKYITPQIIVLDIRVERGFAGSQDSTGLDFETGDWVVGDEDFGGTAE